ncbi:hypothetical protein FG386_000573 [Cryptosporidium ryanae]|uniref:uncharacterized protein n=1 Tax=Cryptosporidium ryanae TaxID=515981 RepID=UPI00351A726A|nr:hypothetical protein FG386_000573 [Cryptosporidium ryanae]
MLTELQKQIHSQLRSNELGYLAHKSYKLKTGKKGRVSFLLDTNVEFYNKKGVTHKTSIPLYEDISQLRYLGEQGLTELESMNPEMSKENFSSLFSSNEFISMQFFNEKEAEEILDKIKKFIDYLVPYFLMDSAKICIEYMIQTYDIHVLLGDYLFYSFLPYHDMAEFSILVQILEINEESEIIGLVESIKKTKSIISSRNQLSVNLIRNQTLFNKLVRFWEQRIENFSATKNTVLINLITWLSIEIINELTKSNEYADNMENCLQNIVSIIVFNLCIRNSRYEELRCAGYCIIYKLSTPLIRLSREVQGRIIYELFNSLMVNQQYGISGYLPEVLFIMNHLISEFKSLVYITTLDYDMSKFILENRTLFLTAIKQLLSWERNILQLFNLIVNSVFDIGLISDPDNYSELCIMFIQELLSDINNHDMSLSLEENYSKLIKVITLSLFDLSVQDESYVNKVIHYLYDNYPSEFMSALGFSLRVSTGAKRARMESFIGKIFQSWNDVNKEESNEGSKMFISLLNSREVEIVNSCINVVRNTILKFGTNFKNITNFEKKIFDISIKHCFDFKDRNEDLFEKYAYELLSAKDTLKMAKYLDNDSKSEKLQKEEAWRTSFILKNILLYISSRINSIKNLDDFIFIEVEGSFGGKCSINDIIASTMFRVFGKEFKDNLLVIIGALFESIRERDYTIDKRDGISKFIMENKNMYIPLLFLISKLKFLSDNSELVNLASELMTVMYSEVEIKLYGENFLKNTRINYLELLLVICSLEDHFEMTNSNHKYSSINEINIYLKINEKTVISLNNNFNFLEIMEYLYYKLYSGIHKSFTSLSKRNNSKNSSFVTITNGTLILQMLRDLLNKGQLLKFGLFKVVNQRLLNIVLLDTLENVYCRRDDKSNNIPSFSLIKECFKPKYDILKLKSLILGLSINLMNLMSYGVEYASKNPLFLSLNTQKKNKLSLFYGKNCYSDTLISHSYSFLEILISNFPLNDGSNVTEMKHLSETIGKLLVYSVVPGLCTTNEFSNSVKMASIRLCKSIREKLSTLRNNQNFSSEFEVKSVISTDREEEYNKVFRSCYFDESFPSLSQMFELFNLIIDYQSKFITNSSSNLLRDMSIEAYKEDSKSDFSQLELILKLNIVVLLEQFSLDINTLCIENIANYIGKSLTCYNNSLKYHKFLLKFLSCFKSKLKLNGDSKDQIILIFLFIRQGTESLKNGFMDNTRKKIICKYISVLNSLKGNNRDGNSYLFEIIKAESDVKRAFEDVILSIMSNDLLINLESEEFVSFISYIVILLSEYAHNILNCISLVSISSSSPYLLDSLIIVLFTYINEQGSDEGESDVEKSVFEQNILNWLYNQISDFNVFGKNVDVEVNTKCIKQVFKYVETKINNIPYLMENKGSNDLDVMVKLIVYSIGVLEYGFRNRMNVKYNEIEFLMDFFKSNMIEIVEKNSPLRLILFNPVVIISITSLFTNIRFGRGKDNTWKCDEDYYKHYFNLYKTLFIMYDCFISGIGKDLSEKNYNIKTIFYSLGIFVEHNLNKCVYFDENSISRMKNVLFNVLISTQISDITNNSLRLNKIEEMISFTEKLHNEIIYYSSEKDKKLFGKNNVFYMIIKSLVNKLINESVKTENLSSLDVLNNNIEEKLDILMDYVINNNLFETKTDLYCNLLSKILDEVETLIDYYRHEKNKDSMYKVSLQSEGNMFLISISIIHFLNKTLFNMDLNVSDCLNLVDLLDKLILLKTAVNRKTLKEVRYSADFENNTEKESLSGEKVRELGFDFSNQKLVKAKTKLKLKSKIDKLESELLFREEGCFTLETKIEADFDLIQEEIDILIKRIIENDTVKKYIALNWDVSKETGFCSKMSQISKKFSNILLSNKLEYLGSVFNEILHKNLKLELIKNLENSEESTMIYNTLVYLLDNKKEYKEEPSKSNVKTWIKKWYIVELMLKILQSHDLSIRRCFVVKILSSIIELYQHYDKKECNCFGIAFKISVIQNFLSVGLLDELDDKKVSIVLLKDMEIILDDVLNTIDFLNSDKSVKLDKKVISLLTSMIINKNNINNTDDQSACESSTTTLALPYISLINNILCSKIGTLVINIGDFKKKLVKMVFLNKRLLFYLNINRLTKLIKNEKIKDQLSANLIDRSRENEDIQDNLMKDISKKGEKINDKNRNMKQKLYMKEIDKCKISGNAGIESIMERNLMKLMLVYCNISYSTSNSDIKVNEDFITDYSDMIKEIVSNVFEMASFSFKGEDMDKKAVSSTRTNYSRVCLLVLMMSYTLDFSQGTSLLNNKSFAEKIMQLYLLLLNFLIINFLKLYSSRESYLNDSETSIFEKADAVSNDIESKKLNNKRKKKQSKSSYNTEFNENSSNDESKLFEFISSILGRNILTSHCMMNESWIGTSYLSEFNNSESIYPSFLDKLSGENDEYNIQIWELESSVMTFLSVFTLKLNSKKLRELVLLIKKLLHRKGESFISKINEIQLNKPKQEDSKSSSKLNEKMFIKDVYNKLQFESKIDLVKDIYSLRIWMLVLLTVIDATGDYGVYCIIEDVVLDIKSVSDLTQMNALACIQNNTLMQYNNESLSSKRSFGYQQIANLNNNTSDFGWYWYHLGIYNLMLIGLIYKSLCTQRDDTKDVPTCIEDHLINPVITNLDMFALFDYSTYSSKFGCGKQWNVIINDTWLNTINCYRNNDLIISNILKSLVNKIRNGTEQVKIFSTEILLLLWKDEICSISILPHISELLPVIKELKSDPSEEVNRIAKLIIKKIQERTGEDISRQL